MIIGNQQAGKKKQGGLVLLVLMIVLVLTFSAYYFSSISIVEIESDNIKKTRTVLKQAKNSLLAYATLRADLSTPSSQPGKYGYLPCPANTNGDGNSMGSCGDENKSYLGWFPWRSLGMSPLKDGNGDCLLYAVSSSYKYNPIAGMLNEDTTYGMLHVVDENNIDIHGELAQDRAIAIVFSAGKALAGQIRVKDPNTECGNDKNNFDAYLDEFEVSPGDVVKNWELESDEKKVDRFVQAASVANEGVINDQLMVITRDEIWPRVIQHREEEFDIADVSGASKVRRLTEALARCLASYANDNDNSSLPFPAPINLGGGDYRDNAAYNDGSFYVGRYPYITDSSDLIVLGTVANNELFKKVFNGPIEPTPPQPIVPPTTYIWQCDALLINSPSGPYADLRASASEGRHLWNNWKDHIIYAISKRYVPSNTPTDDLIEPPPPPAPQVPPPHRCGDCVIFNGTSYAAIVMYSGSRIDEVLPPLPFAFPQIREAEVATIDVGVVVDTKQNINNYIEVTNVNGSGNGDGDFTPKAFSNDLFFCLTDTEPVDVIECI